MMPAAKSTDPAWYELAACQGEGWAGFFDTQEPVPAQEICAQCQVRARCLKFAIDEGITYGVWGGLTPEQRRRARFPKAWVA